MLIQKKILKKLAQDDLKIIPFRPHADFFYLGRVDLSGNFFDLLNGGVEVIDVWVRWVDAFCFFAKFSQ